MTKQITYWVGILWLPITMALVYYTESYFAFGLLMAGLVGWGMGESKSSTTSNYRLGGYEYHTYESPPTPFHVGFSYMAGTLFIGWVIFNIIRWGT